MEKTNEFYIRLLSMFKKNQALSKHKISGRLLCITFFLGAYLYAFNIIAQVTLQGSEFKVNNVTVGDQNLSAIAMDKDGNFVITWGTLGGESGYVNGIYAQRYDAYGNPLGSQITVSASSVGDPHWSDIAMDQNGNFVITWSCRKNQIKEDIFAQRFNSSGVKLGGEFLVNTTTESTQIYPSIAMDKVGNFVITWTSWIETDNTGKVEEIYAQRYNATGVKQGSEFQVNSYTYDTQSRSAIGMDSLGNFVITWYSDSQDGSGYGIYAQRYNTAGTAIGSEFKVNSYTNGYQIVPEIAMGAKGEFIITWQSESQDGSGYGVYAQRYNPAGIPQGSEFAVNTFKTSDQYYSNVAMISKGDFVIAWASESQDGSGRGIYAQRFNSIGIPQSTEFLVNTTTEGSQFASEIAMDQNGNFILTWTSTSLDGNISDIYAQRYSVPLNIPPSISNQNFSIAENTIIGSSIGTVTAYESDAGQTISFAIISGNSTNKFSINSVTGEISTIDYLDYENISTYALTIAVTDNGSPEKTSVATINIAINDISNALDMSDETFTIAENNTAPASIGTIVATNPGKTLLYSIVSGNEAGNFVLNNTSGEITTNNSLDYEITSSFKLLVQATESDDPIKKAFAYITIKVLNISNESNPVILSQVFNVNENSDLYSYLGTVAATDIDIGQSLTYSITEGNTEGKFNISNNGALHLWGNLNFETTSSYTLTIQVSDNGYPIKTASAEITINVIDLVETGIVSSMEKSEFTLFPNPSKDFVYVDLKGKIGINILDFSGRIIKELQTETSSFKIDDLNAGIYTVEISYNVTKVYKKLIIE